MEPLDTMPGGNPVTAVPGLTPRSPLMLLGPVLVTVVPARTAKLPAVPSPTGAVAATAGWEAISTTMGLGAATGPAASQAEPGRPRGARLPISDIMLPSSNDHSQEITNGFSQEIRGHGP